jgi:hypothetical protein
MSSQAGRENPRCPTPSTKSGVYDIFDLTLVLILKSSTGEGYNYRKGRNKLEAAGTVTY